MAIAGVQAALDGVGTAQALYLPVAAKREALREVARAEARLAAVKLSVLAVATDLAAETGARDAGAWLAADQHLDPRTAHADHRLAAALETTWTRTATALATGEVHLEQARAITSVLEQITLDTDKEPDLDPDVVDRAEQTLPVEASTSPPPSSVADGTLLCTHHHLAHDPAYHHERHPDGTIHYHRRT